MIKPNDSYRSSNKTVISGFSRKHSESHIPLVILNLIHKLCTFELFKMGGFRDDSFYIGALKHKNAAEPVHWTLAPEYKFKHCIRGFVCIHHGSFIVIFGGSNCNQRNGTMRFRFNSGRIVNQDQGHRNGIHFLDLTSDCGWTKSPIKCPEKFPTHAVLDDNQRVHLFDTYSSSRMHWVIKLSDIIPELGQGSV